MFQSELLFRAFSAFGIVMTFTQGVALGYHIAALQALNFDLALRSPWGVSPDR